MVLVSRFHCLLMSLPVVVVAACSGTEPSPEKTSRAGKPGQENSDASKTDSPQKVEDAGNAGDATAIEPGGGVADSSATTAPANPVAESIPKDPEVMPVESPAVPIALTSTAFANNGLIPLIHAATAQGGSNMSPPLVWGKAPITAGSIAIQMVDLDSLQGANPRVHWVITDIKVDQTGLPVNIAAGNNLAAPPAALGANQPKNYGGPNPPNSHRYQWTVYAIKKGEALTGLTIDNSAVNKTELEKKAVSMSVLTGIFGAP
jgi:Raf kinase inhibitor-like YbhB/YbcL family protein